MKVVVTEGEIWFLKNIFKKILEPNYLYSYQHKTVVFTVTIRITLFHSLFIKVWKTIFYFYILFMFKSNYATSAYKSSVIARFLV